jgi:aminopeptidase N
MEDASGQDLEWFFQQWIYEPGFPTFEVESEWIPNPPGRGGSLELKIRQVQPDHWPTFRVQMDVEVGTGSNARRQSIEVFERETKVRIGMANEPTASVTLDPDGWVLKGAN